MERYHFYKLREMSRSCSDISSGKKRNYDMKSSLEVGKLWKFCCRSKFTPDNSYLISLSLSSKESIAQDRDRRKAFVPD